jgi:hypothetical protein
MSISARAAREVIQYIYAPRRERRDLRHRIHYRGCAIGEVGRCFSDPDDGGADEDHLG